jgi:hypothetical protein
MWQNKAPRKPRYRSHECRSEGAICESVDNRAATAQFVNYIYIITKEFRYNTQD